MLRAPLVFAALALLGAPALAANRCVDGKGRVTYQDAPCDGNSAGGRSVETGDAFSTRPGRPLPGPAGESSADPAYSTFRGSWRGPAQLKLTIGAARDDPPGVAATVLEVKADGEVAGFVGSGGCKVSGLASQMVAPYIGSLGVTLSGCPDARFNGRYQGQLSAVASAKEGRMTLSTVAIVAGKAQITQIDAVLKR